MKKRVLAALLLALLAFSVLMAGCGSVKKNNTEKDVTDVADKISGMLYDGSSVAPLLIDSGYSQTKTSGRSYEQLLRAVNDLRQDIAMVTGAIDCGELQALFEDSEEKKLERLESADPKGVPELLLDSGSAGYAVIVGVIGESELIDGIIESGSFDEARQLEGRWEAYAIKELKSPVQGIDAALVIAGSDARGAIYGIYTVSEEIGVSPFYWYSDVPVEVRDKIDLDYTTALVDDGPAVKYRGIFINDEEMATGWAKLKFPTENGSPDVNYYRRVFELVLRLKANTLWPAMHGCSTAFNYSVDSDGVPINAKEASSYGIIMAASHCEILLRNNVGEWASWFKAHSSDYPDIYYPNDSYKAYDFTLNREMLMDYWRERLISNKDFESILTLGVRGPHDEAFNCERLDDYEGDTVEQKKVSFMKDVILSQRELIAEVYGEDMVQSVPQAFIPYKEMNDVYNAGLNEFLLWDGSRDLNGDGRVDYLDDNTDIMLMWAEDNENYLRQDLTQAEAERRGGAGIYYHISYWGPPTSYLWLNSTSLYVMSEQMHRGYSIGADDYWILNVGDIKPSEPSMEFFLKMAWDPDSYNEEAVEPYLREQAIRDYGLSSEDAAEMADIICEYYVMSGSIRKAEFYPKSDWGPNAVEFSVTSYGDEALRWLEECSSLCQRLDSLYKDLPEEYKTPFYQHFYYAVLSYNDMAEQFIYYWKNQLAASQGRLGSARVYAELSKSARQRIIDRLEDFNSLSGDKWTGFMNYYHPGHVYNLVGDGGEAYKEVTEAMPTVGAACENSSKAGAGTLRFNSLIPNEEHYFDVFDCSAEERGWTAGADKDWIILSKTSGTTRTEERVTVTVDWDRLEGDASGRISVYNAGSDGEAVGEPVAGFEVVAVRSEAEYGSNRGYIEANGYVAIEAEHYTESKEGKNGSFWEVVKGNGRHGDTVKAMPDTAESTQDWKDSAKLYYSVYFNEAGSYELSLERMPVLNEGNDENGEPRSMSVAVGVGKAEPVLLKGNRMSGSYEMILNMHEKLSCTVTVEKGWNDIVVYMSDASFVWDRMVICTETGAIRSSVLGPCESPNNISPVEPSAPAELPGELLEYSPENEIVLNGLSDIRLAAGGAGECYYSVYSTSGSAVSVEIACDDGRVEAVAENGVIRVTADAELRATLSLTFSAEGCEPLTKAIAVSVYSPEGSGSYSEKDGELLINAKDALDSTAFSWSYTPDGDEWRLTSDGEGLSIQPDTGRKWENTADNLAGAPSLSYLVDISSPGTYYLFVNMSAPNDNADSYHILIDGSYAYTHNSGDMSGMRLWKSTLKAIELSEGEHTVTVVPREDGFVINRLLLTKEKSPELDF